MESTLVQQIAIWALPVLFAITFHEVAHGWVASLCGDQTARLSGRLTLNPLKHIDLIGTIVVPLVMFVSTGFIFGWAKPVPVDARNLYNPRRDMVMVAIAGPLSNFAMALCWALVAKLSFILFNHMPWLGVPIVLMGKAGIFINVVLGVLNCLPVPPLDGGRVLLNLIPGRMAWHAIRFEQYGFLILVLLMLSGVLSNMIGPPIFAIAEWITDLFGLI